VLLGDRFQNGSLYAIGPLSVLSVTLVYCGQAVRWIKMKLDMQVASALATLCVRRGPSSPLQRSTCSLQFSAYICCGQMDGWIKMPLGMEVGLDPRHIVLDGDPAPPKRAIASPTFRSMFIVTKRLDGSRCRLVRRYRPRPAQDTLLHGDPASPVRGTSPNFRPMCIVAKRLPISATVDHLFCDGTCSLVRRIPRSVQAFMHSSR